MWVDIGKLIRQTIPDKNGKTLPWNVTSGSYSICDISGNRTPTLFEGKVIYDKTYGHVAYGCAACCGWTQPVTLWYDPIILTFTDSADDGVFAWYPCESETDDVSSSFTGGWSSSNTSIVTVNTYGVHTGQLVSGTTTQAHGCLPTNDAHRNCPNLCYTPSAPANVTAKILLGGSNGTDVTNKTTNVVVGQQIILYGSYALPSGGSATSFSWSIPGSGSNPPTAISNFTVASDFTSGGPAPLTSGQLSAQSVTFYFVVPGNSQTVTFTLNYTVNGTAQTAATTTATFTVAGITSPSMQTQAYPSLTIQTLTGCGSIPTGPWLEYGNASGAAPGCGSLQGTPGVLFNPSGTQPSGGGTFSFVQLINSSTTTLTQPSGASCTATRTAGLDTAYPYPNVLSGQAVDAPALQLLSNYSAERRSFNASMYLMWTPNPASGCTAGAACTVAVPLGYQTWAFSGSATQNSNGSWTASTGGTPGPTAAFQLANGNYPTWQNISTQGACQ